MLQTVKLQNPKKIMQDAEVFWLFEAKEKRDLKEGVYFENKTGSRLILNYALETDGDQQMQRSILLEACERTFMYFLRRMDLNHSPTIYCSIWKATTAGREYMGKYRIPLRQTLLKKPPIHTPDKGGSIYRLQLLKMQEGGTRELKQHLKNVSKQGKEERKRGSIEFNDPLSLSQLADHVDLHAGNLLRDPSEHSKEDILQVQLEVFRQYFEEALRLGKDRIFVIHGIGKGTLRKRIQEEVRNHPFVASYSDDYHPKYGYGATEIVFE